MLKSRIEFVSLNLFLPLIFLTAIFQLLFDSRQHNFVSIILPYSIAFICYLFLISDKFQLNKFSFWLTCITVYLLAVFSFPNLSDDVYRFLWDGHCMVNRISPYEKLPGQILNESSDIFWRQLYPELNSKNYFSVYPLTCQFIFFASSFAGNTIIQKVILMKIIYLFFHILGYVFISKWNDENTDKLSWQIYYLNPLVILEGIGNLHAEVVMIGLLVPAFYYYFRGKLLISTMFFALSVSTKMTPLMLLPFFFFYDFRNKDFRFTSYTCIILMILFTPLFIGKNAVGFINSLDLYFRKFEFNASIYYVMRWLGKIVTGYNQIAIIGPLLGLCLLIFNLSRSWHFSKYKFDINLFGKSGLILFSAHLLLSTTVHPWYVITVLFFGTIGKIRFPLFWSFLIVLTYINYNGGVYKENYWVVAIEYLLLLLYVFFNSRETLNGWIQKKERSNSI